MDALRLMAETELFKGVGRGTLSLLAPLSRFRLYEEGETVLAEDQAVRSFYVVVSGRVKLYKVSPEGREQTMYLLGPGDPFGMCAAFALEPFPASAVALEKTGILAIPGQAVEEAATREPRLLLNIIDLLSRRLRESMAMIEDLALKEVPERIASFLVHALKGRQPDERRSLELKISQRELAKIIGATPEALSRGLRKMADAGIIAVRGRTVLIMDYEALAALSQG